MQNVMSAFKATEVFPLNRGAVIWLPNRHLILLCYQRTGLAFIPFYSPMRRSSSITQGAQHVSRSAIPSAVTIVHESPPIHFSEEEHHRFSVRFEEGFDISSDERFNQWLKQFKSGASQASVAPNLLLNSHKPSSVLQKFLPELPPQAINIRETYGQGSHKFGT